MAIRHRRPAIAAGIVALALAGCNQTDKIAGWTAAGTLVLAQAPTSELRQTYYIGIFDPMDQVPPAVYRIRLHGQSSFLSETKIQAGWVPAGVADALSSNFSFVANDKPGDGKLGALQVTPAEKTLTTPNFIGRRLVMFGPEGFRESPAEHRFVVVAGSTPEAFFEAVDRVLGDVADARDGKATKELRGTLFELSAALSADRRVLQALKDNLDVDAAKTAN